MVFWVNKFHFDYTCIVRAYSEILMILPITFITNVNTYASVIYGHWILITNVVYQHLIVICTSWYYDPTTRICYIQTLILIYVYFLIWICKNQLHHLQSFYWWKRCESFDKFWEARGVKRIEFSPLNNIFINWKVIHKVNVRKNCLIIWNNKRKKYIFYAL